MMTKKNQRILVFSGVLIFLFLLTSFSFRISIKIFESDKLFSQPISYGMHRGALISYEKDRVDKYLNLRINSSNSVFKIHKSLYDRRRYIEKYFNNEALAFCLKIQCKVTIESHDQDFFVVGGVSARDKVQYVYSLATEKLSILPRENVQAELVGEANAIYWLKIVIPISAAVLSMVTIGLGYSLFRELRTKPL